MLQNSNLREPTYPAISAHLLCMPRVPYILHVVSVHNHIVVVLPIPSVHIDCQILFSFFSTSEEQVASCSSIGYSPDSHSGMFHTRRPVLRADSASLCRKTDSQYGPYFVEQPIRSSRSDQISYSAWRADTRPTSPIIVCHCTLQPTPDNRVPSPGELFQSTRYILA
jgi:hypothetical protein